MSYPACKTDRVIMNNNTYINGQLELGFNNRPGVQRQRQQSRIERAAWWFAKMRSVVDNAIAWDSSKPTHSEQMRLV